MAFYQDLPWHEGEERVRNTLGSPRHDNPTVPGLSPQLANHLQIAPLLAIGTVDNQSRPWTTLWGGEAPLARPLGGGIVGIRTLATGAHDPVVEELLGTDATGEIVREEGQGRMVSGLTINLETRKRVKLFGRMLAGALGSREDEVTGHQETVAEVQLVLKIEQSLGNCPKYLNKKHIIPAVAHPELLSDSPQLSQKAQDLIAKADLFFVSSSQHTQDHDDMDTNHRGGPPGFVRLVSNDESGAIICWPEYSGNRLYQTLGNLAINPKAGICIPDFETGDMLYFTGTTETLVGKDANNVLPRSNLAVKLAITSARYVANALPFRGTPGQLSPYNPVVRYLASEKKTTRPQDQELQQATLLSQTKLTPTISRFRFALENAASYKPGQYVTLDFSEHLDTGYSHMRDDDPTSLNDDFVRTFTVSSKPGSPPDPVQRLKDDQFEITIRKVGAVTEFLFKHEGSEGSNSRGHLEVGVKGFGGEFEVQPDADDKRICFIGAGVGITPLLPSLDVLDAAKLRVLWSVRKEDLPLVLDVLKQHPNVGKSTHVFVSDASDNEVCQVRERGANVHLRRVQSSDVESENDKYYLCTGVPMRKQLLEWLPGKEVIFEDFNF